ncbi:MAG: hypothetical protein KGJ89_02795 [Patescibacteria group bacterium]|nr:hypothetical protein [Patescibacteria group bacterium]MDE2015522.1 hypothetical protein [Patescibacteria group bacterium]MDE2226862.1 hypothetical protein [Patescibacteria group bacterium]
MKKSHLNVLVLTVAVGLLVFAGRSFAEDGGIYVGVQAQTGVRGSSSGSVEVTQHSDVGSRSNGEQENTSTSGFDRSRFNTSTFDEGTSSKNASVISASAVEIRGWDATQKQQFLGTVKAQAELRSGQDLQNFAKGVLLRDDNVEDVQVASDTVKVSYKEPAKLFGVFGSSLSAQVETDAQGRVKVHYPWYSFLFSVPSSVASAELETKLNASIGQTSLQNNLQGQAQVIQSISNILKAAHDTASS